MSEEPPSHSLNFDSQSPMRACETASYPTVWSSGTRGLAVADKLAFRNEGEEDVVVELFIVSE
jgi:hypothetical protein